MDRSIYRRVSVGAWTPGGSLSRLSRSARLLWLFLLTGPPPRKIPGVIESGPWGLLENLTSPADPWDDAEFTAAFRELESEGMVVVDRDHRLVFLPNALQFHPPDSTKNIIGWADSFNGLPDCDLKWMIHSQIADAANLRGDAATATFAEYFHTPPSGSGGVQAHSPSDGPQGGPPHAGRREQGTGKREQGPWKSAGALDDLETHPSQACSVDWWFEEWNTMAREAGLSEVSVISPDRRSLARTLLATLGEDQMRLLINKVRGSKFLRGQSGREGWPGATADWCLSPSHAAKIIDGNYDDHDRRPKQVSTRERWALEQQRLKSETEAATVLPKSAGALEAESSTPSSEAIEGIPGDHSGRMP